MKLRALLLMSTLVASGSWASAQGDPFQRAAPEQVVPGLSPVQAAETAPRPASQLLAQGVGVTAFGAPRVSSTPDQTKVVFDLAPGVTYSLTPSWNGLLIDVYGTQLSATSRSALGPAVSGLRMGGGQILLSTTAGLSGNDGWKATEATLASGSRALILEFGTGVHGGATDSLRALIPSSVSSASVPAFALSATPRSGTTSAARSSLGLSSTISVPSTPPGSGWRPTATSAAPVRAAPVTVQVPLAARPTAPTASVTMTPVPAELGLPPGDDVVVTHPDVAHPSEVEPEIAEVSPLAGRVPGSSQGGLLTAPRIGKNPGMTRVVLDLPPGASYRLQPGKLGLEVVLSGVSASALSENDVTPELRAWRYTPAGESVRLTLTTGTPLTEASGWRAFLLPPLGQSDRSRLAIDVAPAFANLRPLSGQERALTPLSGQAGLNYASAGRPRVVLDPGHGGRDPGAVGTIVEKEVTLAVARRTRDYLQAAGVEVIMTRDSDTELHRDKATDLRMRSSMANNAQLFVSVHVNAMPAQNALKGYGVETWWNPNHPMSASFASILQKNMVDVSGAYSRGLRSSSPLGVLRNNRAPAALVEVGFTSHPVDGLNLRDANYIDRVAFGIAKGVHEALRSGVSAGSAPAAVGRLQGGTP
ncbi:N-acetylmuramoyl-L-alanine amidase [Deinococcus lacus]|uniref:N-acetylmuramoyl-L-alanine amidase n=1 Tax=Deinococcus lacus TaxID=392561 RepID=A0ABW1YCC8_9DEIO